MFDPVYCGELWCYLHLNSSHIERSWFEGYHKLIYGNVIPSWPDEVYEEAENEHYAREFDDIADKGYRGDMHLVTIDHVMHILRIDICSVCYHETLVNINKECFRCNIASRK